MRNISTQQSSSFVDDGEVDAQSRRISALEWLTNRTLGAASIIFLTLLIVWTAILVLGFEFFFRGIVVGHGIDAAFGSFNLIIGFIYVEVNKELRARKRAVMERYFRARLEMRELLFSAVRAKVMTLNEALLHHLALYQTFNRRYIEDVYTFNMKQLYTADDKEALEQRLSNHTVFLADYIVHNRESPSDPSVLLATHVANAKIAIEVPEPGIYRLHTYFLFFVALFVLYPFATWAALGPVLAIIAVPFVLFVLFVLFVVDLVIGDPWDPAREVDIGAHERWFREDVQEFVKHLE